MFVNEPEVPKEYLELDNVTLFPHLGSATVYTRQKMEQLVADNLLAWADGKPVLTPVPETPWPPQKRGVIFCRHGPTCRFRICASDRPRPPLAAADRRLSRRRRRDRTRSAATAHDDRHVGVLHRRPREDLLG